MEAARAASTDDERKHFFDMARMWATAAAKMDGSTSINAGNQFPGLFEVYAAKAASCSGQ